MYAVVEMIMSMRIPTVLKIIHSDASSTWSSHRYVGTGAIKFWSPREIGPFAWIISQ